MAGLRSLVGGEITEYTQLLEEARRHAVDRMVRNANLMHADAKRSRPADAPFGECYCRNSALIFCLKGGCKTNSRAFANT